MKRVCVYIDGSGFYFALKRNNHSTRVDYHELSKALVGPDRTLIRTYYYNSAYDAVASPEQWKSQRSFLESLASSPYLELRLGKLVPQKEGGFKEKGTDVRFATDLVYYAARDIYDVALVITDESDFSFAITQVKELGKNVELCLFPDSQPRELVQASDRIVPLDEVLEGFDKKIFPEVPEIHGENSGNRVQVPISNKTTLFTRTKSISTNKN